MRNSQAKLQIQFRILNNIFAVIRVIRGYNLLGHELQNFHEKNRQLQTICSKIQEIRGNKNSKTFCFPVRIRFS